MRFIITQSELISVWIKDTVRKKFMYHISLFYIHFLLHTHLHVFTHLAC